MSGMKILRLGAWAAVAVLAVASGVLVYQQTTSGPGGSELIDPVATIGGPFELVRGDGTPVTDADLSDRPKVMFFGFTYCPDVCPTTLSEVQGWIDTLGPDADKLHFAFVTVDPERDKPDVINDYVAAFDDRIMALSGSVEQIEAVTKAYRVYAKKVPLDDGDYTMDHSAAVFLMNKDNKFVGTIAYGEAEDTALAKLKRLIASAASS